MFFAVRYVNITDGSIQEHFLTFLQAERLDACSLASYIKQLVSGGDLHPSSWVPGEPTWLLAGRAKREAAVAGLTTLRPCTVRGSDGNEITVEKG